MKKYPCSDNLSFKCGSPIDAANYIGVAYDTTKKYDNLGSKYTLKIYKK